MLPPRTRARIFGEAAELYDRRRPGYPAVLYDDLLAAARPCNRALEAGAGTGIATVEVARRCVEVVAFEHDPAMAALARAAARDLPVQIVEERFEGWDGDPATFDLVFSAQAWHWIDPERGPAVARRALRPGGVLAVWWNQAGDWDGRVREALDDAYRRHAPELERSVVNRPVHQLDPDYLTRHGFEPVTRRSYPWTAHYDARSYTELLQTHSDHRMLPAEQLAALLGAVKRAIDGVGGEIVYPYRTTLLYSVLKQP